MWAYSVVAPQRFERVEVEAPRNQDLTAGKVVLRSIAGGICGSDLGGFMGHRAPVAGDSGPFAPNFPGYPLHEVVDEVVATAHPDVTVGDRVVGWAAGMDGLSEFVLTDGDQVASVDASMEATTAILLQPLACVLSAVDQIRDVEGADVAVIGQGSIGVLFSHVLKHRGARHVVGVDMVSREDVAHRFSVDDSIHATSERWAMQLTDGNRPSIVVEAVGHQTATLGDALDAVAFGGQIYYFGIPEYSPYSFDLWKFLRRNLTMIAGTTVRRRHYLQVAGEYLRRHPELEEGYVSHIHDIDDVQKAFECASVPSAGRLKVAIRMS